VIYCISLGMEATPYGFRLCSQAEVKLGGTTLGRDPVMKDLHALFDVEERVGPTRPKRLEALVALSKKHGSLANAYENGAKIGEVTTEKPAKAKQARASKASVLVASAASQEEASIDHVGVTASPLHAATDAAVGVAASPLNAATPLSMMQP
jgi:hypothetical protein